MGTEIERKFLVEGESWRTVIVSSTKLRQGYLAIDLGNTVRVRTDGREAWVTVKGPTDGLLRPEFEYAIPKDDAGHLLALCRARVVEKIRHRIEYGGYVWEVDEFLGNNRGLILAEIELTAASDLVDKPSWVGREVSGEPMYYNASLSVRPYSEWAPR
ncbi:MAG: CYTH domain-containing protein [Chthoniobacterales bacterium]|nr:CYTH domain-containing protein [Chthoniobacterales bacterium]